MSPHTALLFSALATMADGRASPKGVVNTNIVVSADLPDSSQWLYFKREVGTNYSGTNLPHYSWEERFGLSYVNQTDQVQSLQFNYRLGSNLGHAAPVPEPSTSAMLLAGLASVAALTRRSVSCTPITALLRVISPCPFVT